ncbi:MAG: glycosyltransferase family 2 protein [Candidatus Stahlbacteria bacterium]|nr:glycosyltransferase family 2 protein [Candidatus Stahlbacteria bacterium]
MDWKFHTSLELVFRQEPFIRFFRKKLIRYSSPSIPTETDVVSDGFMLVRREALFEIGLYDERFLMYFTEDDLCHRLKRAEWKVYYFPDSSIIHKLFGSVKRVPKIKMAYIRTIDTLKYCAKYYELPIAFLISLFVLLGFIIELIKLLKGVKCQV